MQYQGLAWVLGLLGLIMLWVGARILFNRHWFLGWLRGTAGLAFVAVSGLIALLAYDVLSYRPLPVDKPLATLSFKAEGSAYRVTLLQGSEERSEWLEGDLWQLDARLLQWKGLARLIGLEPGYRLEKLSGRFLSIEQQNLAQRTRVPLARSLYGVDLWHWLRINQRDLFMFDPQAVRVTYLPMADDAVYSVTLSPTGLLAQPMNEAARQALQDWQ